jgi:hypothetical protein
VQTIHVEFEIFRCGSSLKYETPFRELRKREIKTTRWQRNPELRYESDKSFLLNL